MQIAYYKHRPGFCSYAGWIGDEGMAGLRFPAYFASLRLFGLTAKPQSTRGKSSKKHLQVFSY